MTDWSAWLGTVEASRILEMPRRSMTPDRPADVGRRQRLAAVVSAYHGAGGSATGREAVVFGWHRVAAGAPIEVFSAGLLAGTCDAAGAVRLALPQGGIGTRYPNGTLLDRLRAVPCWTGIAGVADGLLVDDPTTQPEEARPSLDECLLKVWHDAFAWFVLAEPLPAAALTEVAATVAAQERAALSKSAAPEQAVLATRLQRRHRELRQGASTGMWRVHVLVGGATPASVGVVAGLLCASVDLSRLPYALTRTDTVSDLDGVLAAADHDDSPFLGSSLLVASLAVPPVDEVPGVRMTLGSEFDVTPETAGDGHGLPLGVVLDHGGVAVEQFRIPTESLNRHMFVCGSTGAGKSQTIRGLLEAAAARELPWLVVEPAKSEYRRMADRLGADRVIAIRPGDPEAPPAGFNPLRPAVGFPLQTHLDLVRSLYLAAFEADEPFPQVLSGALTRCYEDLGWDLALGEPRVPGTRPRWPTLGDLQQAAERVVDEIGYGKEITDNVRGFIRIRLSSLRLGTTGRLFEGGHPLDFAVLVRRNVVFEIEDVGDDRDKAFLMGALLIQLVEHRRVEARRDPAVLRAGLRHLSVFEEAHRLLRRSEVAGPAARAVELFASMLAEIRAYGEGLVIAEQIPSKLVADVIKNTAVKVMHRLPARDDRDAVGATINLTDRQSRYLVTLSPGTGAVFTDGMDQPVLVRMQDGTLRERGETATAAVTGLIGRRSTTCGPDCHAAACTLRDMRAGQHLLDDEPWIVLWAELSVLGHLTGWPSPVLRSARMRALFPRRGRLLDCALSHAVDDAVAARSSVLAIDPDVLAVHVRDTLLGHLDGENRCGSVELHYLARPYRWSRLHDELSHADPAGGRHPRTEEWRRTYGRPIPGATTGEQLAAVTAWFDADLSDATARSAVWFGIRTRSAIELSVGSVYGAPDWAGRLKMVLHEQFAGCSWPERYLTGTEDR